AIRRDDFTWPAGYHAERLFAEKVGPVCRPDKVDPWFSDSRDGRALKRGAPRLHTRTRPDAWKEWAAVAHQPAGSGRGQMFDHFYFSLQAAVAGLGVAIGPWHLVRDDLASGVLVAPMGFVEDGSHYCLLTPEPVKDGSAQSALL
ncbi:LysR substrate-binding domain-containing protein, partial [Paraburkholderia sp. SIMBA_050]